MLCLPYLFLFTFDDLNLREKITFILSPQIKNRRFWSTDRYEISITKVACENGNLGFIKWLERNHMLFSEAVENMANIAANASQWHLVLHVLQHYELAQKVTDHLFLLASKQNVISIIPHLWHNETNKPGLTILRQAMAVAKQMQDNRLLQILEPIHAQATSKSLTTLGLFVSRLHLEQRPSPETRNGFKQPEMYRQLP